MCPAVSFYICDRSAPRRGAFFYASGGPISSNSGRNGGKNAAKNPWFLDFLPPLAAVRGFVRNVELTCSSERCRFCSEMQGAVFYRFLRLSNRLKTVEPGTPTFCTASGSGDRRRPMPHFGQLLPCSARVGYLPHSTPHGARADFQTAGLNGVFAHFCRRGQKWVAPERETLLTAGLWSLPFGKESDPSETPPYPQARKIMAPPEVKAVPPHKKSRREPSFLM